MLVGACSRSSPAALSEADRPPKSSTLSPSSQAGMALKCRCLVLSSSAWPKECQCLSSSSVSSADPGRVLAATCSSVRGR